MKVGGKSEMSIRSRSLITSRGADGRLGGNIGQLVYFETLNKI